MRRVRIKQETAAVSFTVATVLCGGGDKSEFVKEAAVRKIILIL